MRRLPVYLLIDTSGSMKGEPLESVKSGLQAMLSGLRQDPHALESLHLSIITFDREVKVVLPLSSLETMQLPTIVCPDSGPTNLGAALETLCSQVDKEVQRSAGENKGDWKPILFVMTDGSPSDVMDYKAAIPKVKSRGFATIVACAAGPKAKKEDLSPLADHVVTLETMDSSGFLSFFRWVSSSVAAGNVSMGASSSLNLPPPPPEVNLVF